MSDKENTTFTSIAEPGNKSGGNEMAVRKYGDKYEIAIPDGRYDNGRVKYKRELADTEKEAYKRERELSDEIKELRKAIYVIQGQVVSERPRTVFKNVAQKWLKHKKLEVVPRTWERYKEILNYHILPFFGEKVVPDIDEESVHDYLLGNINSNTTLKQHYVILKNVFKLAGSNVMENIKSPARDFVEINCIKDPTELAEFVASLKESVIFLPVYIAAVTGMRLSEIAGLRWSDINFDMNIITISRSLHWTRGKDKKWYVKSTKNGSSKRSIKISGKDIEVLNWAKEKRGASNNDFVCIDSKNNPLNNDHLSANFKARAKVRGYNISFHSLRHSHATLLIQYYRKSIKAVSKRLGHADEVTTLRIYASILPPEDGDIADTMGELMKDV